MPMRLSGLVTGMDTEALVGQLVDAQNMKKKKISGNKTKLEWKKDAWKDLNKKLTSFYNGAVSKMRLSSSYNVKKATLSDTTKAKIEAQPNAVTGNYSLEVKSIASAQFLTSGKAEVTSTSQKLTDLGLAEGQTISFKVEGKNPVELTIEEGTTVNDFLKTARDAGINASYDSGQKKFFFSSKETGKANAFSINDGGDGLSLKKLGLANISYSEDEDGNLVYSKSAGAPSDMAIKEAKDSHG